MMKSIALLNDSNHHADEEGDGFVLVDSPLGFDEDEEFSLVDDAFSCSSLHQTLPMSSLPMESVQDNFFEPPIGQEVVPPAVPSSPSLLSDDEDVGDDDDDDDNALSCPTEDSSGEAIVLPSITSGILCSLPSAPSSNSLTDIENSAKQDSSESCRDSAGDERAGEHHNDAGSAAALTNTSEDDYEEEEEAPTSPSSASAGCTDDDDGVDSSGPEKAESDPGSNATVGRVSKKKRRKQLKLAKKAAAATAAAAAIGQMTLRSTNTPKRKVKGSRKKVANIAVACAVQSIAEYKHEVEVNSNSTKAKKIR